MSISKRERHTPRPPHPARGVAPPALSGGETPDPLTRGGVDGGVDGGDGGVDGGVDVSAVARRLAEAIAAQDRLFAGLRSYPLEAGEEPAVVFRP